MLFNVLKTCSKSRICSDEQFLIQRNVFFDRPKYEHSLQSGDIAQNTLSNILCICGASLAIGRTCPDVSGRTSP